MGKVRFELNRAGVAELLKGAEMQAILTEKAEEVHGRCTAGSVGTDEYSVNTAVKGSRDRKSVV